MTAKSAYFVYFDVNPGDTSKIVANLLATISFVANEMRFH